MSITKDDVLHVAELARLALTDDEIVLYTAQMQRILNYVEKLSEVSTSGVPPAVFASEAGSALRDDLVTGSIGREEALNNAPDKERGCFKVPKIIE